MSALQARITSTDQEGKEGDALRNMLPTRIRTFRKQVWGHWREHGRHDLPWRKTTDPYKVLVSEVMLQQTQVSRVIERYHSFTKKFPTVAALAKAPLSAVLKEWSGLGYNRRGKYLHDAAKTLMLTSSGREKLAWTDLEALPGVGPYTASALRVFAFDEPDVLIETNIRAAFIQYFFPPTHKGRSFAGASLQRTVLCKDRISDREILPIAREAAKGQDPRMWHWALMDYGAHLKSNGVRNNARSAQYKKQSKFEGSLRQTRGAILRALSDGPLSDIQLHQKIMIYHNFERQKKKALGGLVWGAILRELHKGPSFVTQESLYYSKVQLRKALAALEREGLIRVEKGKWRIA